MGYSIQEKLDILNAQIGRINAEVEKLRDELRTAAGREIRTVKVGDLEWQADVPDKRFTWEEAKAYAASRGDGWRLPTIQELLSLVDYTTYKPACRVFPDCPSEWFWSSSAFSGSSTSAWYVNFSIGHTGNFDVSGANRVRCVR